MPNSANMNLPIPSVGITSGPDYATQINSCLTLIDSHDHSAGYGVPITPSGLNISADLSFIENNATDLRSVRFTTQDTPISESTDLGCLYRSGVDLYFNDGNGNQIQITDSGGVAGSPGSIANLTSPASASYVSLSETFVWESDTNTAANMDCRNIILRNSTASSNGLTLSPPNAMGSNYTITLPALPAGARFMTIDNTGAISASWNYDNSTITVSSNNLKVKDAGIGPTQLASSVAGSGLSGGAGSALSINVDNSTVEINADTLRVKAGGIGQSQLADNNVTIQKLATCVSSSSPAPAGDVLLTSSCGAFATTSTSGASVTNLSGDLAVVKRPVLVGLVSDGSGNNSIIGSNNGDSTISVILTRNGTEIANVAIQAGTAVINSLVAPAPFSHVDFPGAGTHTYAVKLKTSSGGTTAQLNYVKLFAVEI